MTQPSQHPALHDLDGNLDFGLAKANQRRPALTRMKRWA